MAYKTEDLRPIRVEVTIHVDDSKEFTTVALNTDINGLPLGGIGTAKRNRTDKYNETVGGTLALARAFRDLATDLEGLAHEADGTHR